MGDVVALTEEELDAWLKGRPEPLLVEFHSRFCLVCQRMESAVAALADELGEQVAAAKLDVTDYPDLTERYELDTVPTVMLFREGRSFRVAEGAFTKNTVKNRIERALRE